MMDLQELKKRIQELGMEVFLQVGTENTDIKTGRVDEVVEFFPEECRCYREVCSMYAEVVC